MFNGHVRPGTPMKIVSIDTEEEYGYKLKIDEYNNRYEDDDGNEVTQDFTEEEMLILGGIESEEYEAKKAREREEKEEQERQEDAKMLSLVDELKEKIGSHVYWAWKGWSRNPKTIEDHVISDFKYGLYKGDFFREYNGKKVIMVHVADGGFYIYNELGRSIFFSREDAEKSLL